MVQRRTTKPARSSAPTSGGPRATASTPDESPSRGHARHQAEATPARSHPTAHGAHGPHDEHAKAKIVARLRSVEGHLRGVLAMVESDAYCIDVLRQTKAIQAALGRIDGLLLERHLSHCASTAIRSEDASARERVIAELLDVFDATRRG